MGQVRKTSLALGIGLHFMTRCCPKHSMKDVLIVSHSVRSTTADMTLARLCDLILDAPKFGHLFPYLVCKNAHGQGHIVQKHK